MTHLSFKTDWMTRYNNIDSDTILKFVISSWKIDIIMKSSPNLYLLYIHFVVIRYGIYPWNTYVQNFNFFFVSQSYSILSNQYVRHLLKVQSPFMLSTFLTLGNHIKPSLLHREEKASCLPTHDAIRFFSLFLLRFPNFSTLNKTTFSFFLLFAKGKNINIEKKIFK